MHVKYWFRRVPLWKKQVLLTGILQQFFFFYSKIIMITAKVKGYYSTRFTICQYLFASIHNVKKVITRKEMTIWYFGKVQIEEIQNKIRKINSLLAGEEKLLPCLRTPGGGAWYKKPPSSFYLLTCFCLLHVDIMRIFKGNNS